MNIGTDIVRLIGRWNPKKWHSTKEDFQNDLAKYLRNNLPSYFNEKIITKSTTHDVDIQVGKDIGIEFTIDLTLEKVEPLMNRIRGFSFQRTIAMICGVEDEDAWKEFNLRLDRQFGTIFVTKKVASIRKDEKQMSLKKKSKKKKGGLFSYFPDGFVPPLPPSTWGII